MRASFAMGRQFKSWSVTIIAVLGLGGLLTLPFFFESSTMYYKFGWDKILLRSGKMVGLAATFSLLLQLPLAGRLKWLDRIYALPTLYRIHRINAWCLMLLVFVHPILVFVPDGTLMIPFEGRYWPEWVGAALVLVIAGQLVFSRWRLFFFKAYQRWQMLHRVLGVAAMGLVIIHVLFVSETFEQPGLPRTLVLCAAFLLVALWIWIRIRTRFARNTAYRLTGIHPAGKDAYTLELTSKKTPPFKYLPGQFAFLSLVSEKVSKEFHPFTLSSSPSRPQHIEMTIRCCGDWTDQIYALKKGDRAAVEGPYGLFSYSLLPPHQEIILIAGGIGITPMLSMLRHMADTNAERSVTLIWSNQTRAHLFGGDELDALTQKLTDFRWVPIFTREKTEEGHSGRLDKEMLASLLKKNNRNAAIFVCGPPQMIQQVGESLQRIGFSPRSIHSELFGL